MARRKTIEEMLEEAEKGKSGGTLGENIRGREKDKEPKPEDKKKKRGWFSGRRDKRTVLSAEEA